ncbi:MAG: altronate dehydratase [Planctomycetales bacterium]|nr:altronate dehydratase [Planctomycetales bacterium]
MTAAALHLHPTDNTCVAVAALQAGELIQAGEHQVQLVEDVPFGHKIALQPIARGRAILKYGQTLGFAARDIEPGQWVHTHNVELGELRLDYAPASETPAPPEPMTDQTFQGYRRADGRYGTRNYLAVISTVNCSASVARYIAERFNGDALQAFPNIDGVVAFRHQSGCAMQFDGLNHRILNRVSGGIAKHPNIGGVLLVGLGCEQAAMGHLVQSQGLLQIGDNGQSHGPVMLSMQDVGGTRKTVEAGIEHVARLLPRANDVRRETAPASELILATECGGSDGNSGITANPAVGVAADLLVACGGTAILAETSEVFGAEHLLTRRAVSAEVANKLIERIEWWKEYASLHGGELDNNPSVGNKAGGLTTIVEKSLGAVAKGGSTALVDVYHYAEPVVAKGFVFMDTPGFDPPSVTGMVAGGANVAVFTTGRGSCFGCKPTPCLKIATNTPMFERLEEDMDINAGQVLSGKTVAEMGREIFDHVLEVASGRPTKSEQLGIGDDEFVPWNVGPVL